MDFSLSQETTFLAETARRFIKDEIGIEYVREVDRSPSGLSREKWKKMAELGWHELGTLAGESLLDLCVLVREFGAALVPGPYLANALCGFVIAQAGNDQQRQLLDGLICGSEIHTYAVAEGTGEWSFDEISLQADVAEGGFVLSGKKFYSPECVDADYVHVYAKTAEGQLAVFIIPTDAGGLDLKEVKTIGGDRQSNVELSRVFVPSVDVIELDAETVRDIWNVANCLECAYLVGLASRSSSRAVEYVKERVQFGKPVGSFQALHQKCADSLIDLEGMELLMYRAAWTTQEKGPDRDVVVAMAKSWCSDVSRRIVWRSQQMNGAAGFTERDDTQLYFRRQRRPAFFWGTADYHRSRIGKS